MFHCFTINSSFMDWKVGLIKTCVVEYLSLAQEHEKRDDQDNDMTNDHDDVGALKISSIKALKMLDYQVDLSSRNSEERKHSSLHKKR